MKGSKNDTKSSSSCTSSSGSTKTCYKHERTPCCEDQCTIGQFAINYLESMLGPLIDENGIAIRATARIEGPRIVDANGHIIINKYELVLGQTYYVVRSEDILSGLYVSGVSNPDAAALQSFIDYMLATSYVFTYTYELASVDFGNANSVNKLGEYLSLVGYVLDRINKLCLPCCVKEKITNTVMAYVTNNLAPIDGDGMPGTLPALSAQPGNLFCNDTNIPACGPIYVTYYSVSSSDNDTFPDDIYAIQGTPFPIPEKYDNDISAYVTDYANSNNYVMNFLNIVQFYLRSLISTKCCCGEDHSSCDCKIKYHEVCQFVFGRFCVIERKLVWLDFQT